MKIYHFVPFLLALLLLQISIPVSTQVSDQQTKIILTSTEPTVIFVNQTVTIRAQIQVAVTDTLENVTLRVEHQEISTYLMIGNNNEYNKSLQFSQAGEVTYEVLLFVEGDPQPVDTSGLKTFNVNLSIADLAPIEFNFNETLNIPVGNITIVAPNNTASINLLINSPVQLNITRQDREESRVPSDTIALSDLLDITVNDTGALDSAIIRIQYNQTVIDQLGIVEELLQLRNRENTTQQWQPVETTVDKDNNTVETTTDHFSQWIVTASTPKLRFINTTDSINLSTSTTYTLDTYTKNQGSYTAENVSIRIVTPTAVIVDNITTIATIDRVDPLDTVVISWNIIIEDPGEYNLVIYAESSNIDGDIIEVRINVEGVQETTTTTPDTSQSQPQETPFFFHLTSVSIMIYIGRRWYGRTR